ncbi:uncharacterized protein LOC143956073 [Lithobates pipiens]
MTTSLMMDKGWSHSMENIMNLTLEIIYQLTREDYVVVKKSSGEPISGGWSRTQSPTMVPPPPPPIPERSKEQKILELTTMMVHLLTGEVRRILGILGHYPVTDKGCVWMVTVSLCVSGSYKVSGCHCLFLHGGVGVFRRTQGSLQGRHDGELADFEFCENCGQEKDVEPHPGDPQPADWRGLRISNEMFYRR